MAVDTANPSFTQSPTPLTTLDPSVEFPYRELSKLAIGAAFLVPLAMIGWVPLFEPLLSLSVVGIACGLMAISAIRQFPREYAGLALAQAAVALNALVLVAGCSIHTYIYFTEVPDGYERVAFYELERTKGVDAPTDKAIEIDGKEVFLKGYIHPASGNGDLKRFILVPDLGTCCFGGQPRSSSMIEVLLSGNKTVRYGRTKLKLAGKFEINKSLRTVSEIDNLVFYRLRADYLK